MDYISFVALYLVMLLPTFCLLGKDCWFAAIINFPSSATELVALQPLMEFGLPTVPSCRYLESNLYTSSAYTLKQAALQRS